MKTDEELKSYSHPSSLSMNAPLENRLKVCLLCNPFSPTPFYDTSAENFPYKRWWKIRTSHMVIHPSQMLPPANSRPWLMHDCSSVDHFRTAPIPFTRESQVFRYNSYGDNHDLSQREHIATSQCVNHVRRDQLDDYVLERIIVYRRELEALEVETEICMYNFNQV